MYGDNDVPANDVNARGSLLELLRLEDPFDSEHSRESGRGHELVVVSGALQCNALGMPTGFGCDRSRCRVQALL